MRTIFTAVLINVTGIQQFIFHSNKLKENIGASYIIENEIYNELMIDMLETFFPKTFAKEWRENTEVQMKKVGSEILCEIGYIGGGNTLLLFDNEALAKGFIKEFSKKVLCLYPSLQLVFGLRNDFDLSKGKYAESYQKLLGDLKIRKSAAIPLVSVPKHGITADCPWSNESAEVWEANEKIYVSTSTYSKIVATKEAQKNEKQKEMYSNLMETYMLTDDIERLGQNEEGAYIAVVHIDGNGMGKIFSQIDSLEELRKTSDEVSRKATDAMNLLIKQLTSDYESLKLFDLEKQVNKTENKYILPIRPILVGGDDITFICEGRLGIYLAEKFIANFYDKKERDKALKVAEAVKGLTGTAKEEAEIQAKKDENVLMDGACAGVAIVKTHFPFYKAVHLAEELCAEAKALARGNEKGEQKGSYISYYYSATTFSGSLKQLRARTHTGDKGKNLYFGPYRLFAEKEANSIENLKKGILYFLKSNNWSKNKVMRLREILAESSSSQAFFMRDMNIGTDKSKYQITFSNEKTEIWEQDKTPFFDQIELMDFYLDTLLPPLAK